jgi:hypothetical protein
VAGLLGDSGAAACLRPMGGSPPVAGAAAAPMPRTRRQAVPAATFPQRRASTNGRAVLLAPGSLSPRKITIKGTPAACRRFAAQTLDTDLSRQDLGTYQEDGADSTQTTERRTRKVRGPKSLRGALRRRRGKGGARVSEAGNIEAPKNATGKADPAVASGKPSRARRMIHILGAVLVAVVLPVVLIDALVGKFGADAMIIGLLVGVLGSKVGGTRRMLYVAPWVGVAAGLGAFTAYHWWWVALLAILAVIAGAGMRFGWHLPLLMLPFAATFATREPSGKDAVIYGVIAGIATLYGVVLMRRFKAPEVVEGQRLSLPAAVAVAIVFGVAVGGAAAIGVALGWTEPYWVPEPVLILALYVIMGKRERIREKALGTALGAVAAIPLAIVGLPAWAISVLAAVALVLAIWQYKTYWLYYAFWTFAIILALSPPGQVGTEAAHRGSEILVGIGILVVALVIMQALGTWLSKRYPQPELAEIGPQ